MEVRQRKPEDSVSRPKVPKEEDDLPFHSNPSAIVCFLGFLLVQALSARFNYISDCDEVFNYWEPTYFLQYGRGLQTWEYSPEYALRSYAYLYPQTLVATAAQHLGFTKVEQFYLVRLFLGTVCALCQTYLYSSIKKHPDYNGTRVPLVTFIFLAFSTGMFVSGTAYLPSTFAMCCFMIAQGSWLSERYSLSIIMVAVASLVGWPFAALVGLPVALDALYKRGILYFISWSIIGAAISLVPLILIDTSLYNKLVIAPLNIVLYNVFKGGSSLYGTEPWHFYLLNGFLNFNFILPLALIAIPLAVLPLGPKSASRSKFRSALYHFPMLIWFAFMSSVEHKEERFLFVVYPLIAFAGACALLSIEDLLTSIGSFVIQERKVRSFAKVLTTLVIIVVCVLSVSRGLALYNNYSAPMKLYNHISTLKPCGSEQVNVCVGKEWYRFSSEYFFPNDHFNLTFVHDGPQSQLPQYYPSTAAEIQDNFNDQNEDEESRYIDIDKCHYLIRNDPKDIPNNWEIAASYPFLDSANSPTLFRAFYIPTLSPKRNKWTDYTLLKNKQLC